MLYEMILGEPPFSGDTPDEIFAQVALFTLCCVVLCVFSWPADARSLFCFGFAHKCAKTQVRNFGDSLLYRYRFLVVVFWCMLTDRLC